MNPTRLIFIGFLGVFTGAALPFLMVIGVVKASLFLSFISYGSSVGGMFLGLIGAAAMAGRRRREEDGDSMFDGHPNGGQPSQHSPVRGP